MAHEISTEEWEIIDQIIIPDRVLRFLEHHIRQRAKTEEVPHTFTEWIHAIKQIKEHKPAYRIEIVDEQSWNSILELMF